MSDACTYVVMVLLRYTVLVRLASLLTYKPSTALRAQQYSQPVHEFLASHEGKALIARFKLQSMELP